MIVLLFEIRTFYLGTLEPEHDFMMKCISRTENENPCFREKHKFDWQIPSQNEMLMKSWYLLVVLAVISVFAVCRFNTINTSFLRKLFSRRNINFRVLWFFRISADPASGAYRKHSQASGLPKSIPLGIPRPISRKTVQRKPILCVFIRFYIISIYGPPLLLN